MRGITKSFPGVRALRGVDLTLHRGEVLALMGENGAGKSTLIKVLAGAVRPDAGTIHLAGREVQFLSPHQAHQAGLAVIYQEFNLVPALSASANLFLGQEQSHAGFLARRREAQRSRELFARLGVRIDPDAPVRSLSTAQQQAIEIARALTVNARIVVMDEPTASLTAHEVEHLFRIIRDLQAAGIGIIYVSHRLEEIFALADRVLVLRDGERVGERPIAEVDRAALIEMMVGRELQDEFPPRAVQRGEPRLIVEGLRRGRAVQDVSFQVARGEVLALTGLVGAGRTETARLIFGADAREAGRICLDGRELTIRQPRDAIRAGIGLLTEDRKTQGLILAHGVRTNFGLPNLPWLSRWGFVRTRQEKQEFASYVRSLNIKIPHADQLARNLSGGNQQKVVLAKWLARHCEVLIFDEPTRGIDVGAKREIYQLINDLAAQGKAIVLISSEMPEVLGMADRILVMHGGRIRGEFTDLTTVTQEQILDKAMGET
ncbi:MAG: sugar ABC transporter ATP-binding protein [Planctomycetia bacterium]|nr:sugar ABC transporter ATP-binding protein [Planctomycetia bacterium]